ncbi:MAG: hypothetical protein U0174_21545 [Polyangiaceae bacterium]
MRLWLLTVSALFCACASESAPESEQGAGTSSIIGTQRDASGYTEGLMVKVNNVENDFCTGVMIAPGVAITAAHCVAFNPQGTSPLGTWTLTAPFASGGSQTRTASTGDVMDQGFRGLTRFNYDSHPEFHDIGVLFPDVRFTGITFPTITGTAPAQGTSVSAVGRKTVNVTAPLVLSAAVSLGYVTDGSYPFDFITSRVTDGGDSGGPLFVNGTHTLIATETRFNPTTAKDYWVRLDGAVYTWLNDVVNSHGGWDGTLPIYTPQTLKVAVRDAICDRVQVGCCNNLGAGGAPFNRAQCNTFMEGGIENSFAQVSAPGVDLSKVTVNQLKAQSCVAKLQNLTCPSVGTPAAEYRLAVSECFAALGGTVAIGSACHTDLECKTGAYCNQSTAKCTALSALGAVCSNGEGATSDTCSNRGSGDTGRRCGPAFKCVASATAGQACYTNATCGTGTTCSYDFGLSKAVCSAQLNDPQLCTYF